MELIVEFLESAVLRRDKANFIVISLSVSSVGVLEQYSVPKSNSHHEYSEDLEDIIRMLSNYFWRYSNEISFDYLIRIIDLSNIHFLFLIWNEVRWTYCCYFAILTELKKIIWRRCNFCTLNSKFFLLFPQVSPTWLYNLLCINIHTSFLWRMAHVANCYSTLALKKTGKRSIIC